ncbi:MAG: hypothetical protein J0M02_12600 [Planctomycetes bacterium]|nr:hypothetical protein [Planctomycetota bacterium]
MPRSGITLIEVLVTVVTGALLAMLLLPAMRQVRMSASQARCANALRNLGAGLIAYAQDNRGCTIPAGGMTIAGTAWSWRGLLSSHLETGWEDPQSLTPGLRCRDSRRGAQSYVMNQFFGKKVPVRGLRSLRSANTTIMVMDGGWEFNQSTASYNYLDIHSPNRWRLFYRYCHKSPGRDIYETKGRMNAVFADLHIANLVDGDGVVTRPHEQCPRLNPWYPDDYCHGQPGTGGTIYP